MRRSAIVLFLVSLPLAAAACGKSSKPKASSASSGAAAIDVVKSAAKKTALAGSEHVTVDVGGTTSGQQLTVTGAGDFDNKGHIGSLHIDVAAAGISTTLDAVLSHTDMYLKGPLFAALLPAGKTWMKIDLQQAGAAQGLNLSTILSQDPTQSLATLQSLKGATSVGAETIDGVATTHYRARIDLSKLPAVAGGASAAPSTYDAWIGGDGYVYRVRSHIATGSGTTKSVITLTVDLSGFGKKVSVSIPPAAQTVASKGGLPGLGG